MRQWKARKLTYDILIPPLEKPVGQLREEEAAEYFRWFMEKIPERVAYLSEVCAKELRIPKEKMDLSQESLVLLWKWFRKRAKTEVLTPENSEKTKFFRDMGTKQRQFTLETEYILRDVGMYFGAVFRQHYPKLYWSYDTQNKRDFFVNCPVLKGFVDKSTGKPWDAVLEPIHFARVQTAGILTNRWKEDDLLRIYEIWAEKAENGAR